MSTVVRSLAAKVEVQTREAEQNLDRFRAKLRATDVQLRGASAYQNVGASPLYSAGAVARQSVAARGIAVQEMFAAQQARMAGVGAIGSLSPSGVRSYNATVTSQEIAGLTLRGGGSIGVGGNALGELAGAGVAGQAGSALAKVKGLARFSSLLRGAGPIAAGVVTLRHAIQTTSDVIDNMENVTSDNNSAWLNFGLVSMDAVSRFTMFKGPMDDIAKSFVNLTDYGAKATARTEALTASLSEQADAAMNLRTERDKGSAEMAQEFAHSLASAEIESLAERAEQTQRFADMQKVASSAAERYDARVNELRMSLMAGAISQDAFNESMKSANETYDEQSGVLDTIREQQQEIRDYWEDRRRAEREAAALSKQTAMEEEDRLRRERRMEGVALDASRIFVGRGASGVGKQSVEDQQLKITNTLLRRLVDREPVARAG